VTAARVNMADIAAKFDYSPFKSVDLLTQYNYPTWARRMCSAFKANEAWAIIVEGPTPTQAALDAKAKCVIESRVSENLLHFIKEDANAKQVWDTFASIFRESTNARKNVLQQKLHVLALGSN
jgi:hypothetical protein